MRVELAMLLLAAVFGTASVYFFARALAVLGTCLG